MARFDPEKISFETLVRRAGELQCASRIFTRSDEQQKIAATIVNAKAVRTDDEIVADKQPKYHLSRTPMRFLPMTPMQTCRVNAALGAQRDARMFLSPRQIDLLTTVEKNPNAGWESAVGTTNLHLAWDTAQSVAERAKSR